jgi:hypothetical protein
MRCLALFGLLVLLAGCGRDTWEPSAPVAPKAAKKQCHPTDQKLCPGGFACICVDLTSGAVYEPFSEDQSR